MKIELNREEFEDKFQIKMMLYQLHGKIAFIDEINDYRPTITNQGELTENEHRGVAWMQGAWYAFQEQQKRLDCCREENKAHLEKVDELQARINKAMKYVSESPLKDVSRRGMINFMDILKGNKDEN